MTSPDLWTPEDKDAAILAGFLGFLLVYALVVAWNRADAALAFIAVVFLGCIAALLYEACRGDAPNNKGNE